MASVLMSELLTPSSRLLVLHMRPTLRYVMTEANATCSKEYGAVSDSKLVCSRHLLDRLMAKLLTQQSQSLGLQKQPYLVFSAEVISLAPVQLTLR